MGATYITGVDHLSPSGASVLVDCERRFYWNYRHKLGRDERTEPLAMGGGLAAALEFGDLELGLREYHDRRPIADGWTDPEADERAIWVAEASIRAAYAGYLQHWPDEDVEREVTHFVRLPGSQRMLQVRIDGVAPGFLVEDKFRSGSSLRADAIENEVRMGRQLSAEIYGHWRKTGDLLPARLRCVKKIDPRKVKPTKDREITQDYVETAIAEHFAGEGVFNQWDVTRTEYQLYEFEREFSSLIERADRLLISDEPAGARNEKACHAYGRTCPALAHCQGIASTSDLLNTEGNA